MTHKNARPYLLLCVLLLGTVVAVTFAGSPRTVTEPDITTVLPVTIDDWRGEDMFYCQDIECRGGFSRDVLPDITVCPVCGGDLGELSPAEQRLLPVDAAVVRKLYTRADGQQVLVSIVITGDQRAGIHRPRWCLPAQGYSIMSSRLVDVPVPGRTDPLTAKILDVSRKQVLPSGEQREMFSLFAYWFVGHQQETPHHETTLFWMAVDSVFRDRIQKWAYISVITDSTGNIDRDNDKISGFLGELYPLMVAETDGQGGGPDHDGHVEEGEEPGSE